MGRPGTLVTKEKRKTLVELLKRCRAIPGEVWECGVYHGGTAYLLYENTKKVIRLFDSWEGLPEPSPEDTHQKGQFGDVNFGNVKAWFKDAKNVHFHKGWIPSTFAGLEKSKISFAHIDLDLYHSYLDALNFIYPRLSIGGIMVFDDYKVVSCKGATQAVDEFFADKEKIHYLDCSYYYTRTDGR